MQRPTILLESTPTGLWPLVVETRPPPFTCVSIFAKIDTCSEHGFYPRR